MLLQSWFITTIGELTGEGTYDRSEIQNTVLTIVSKNHLRIRHSHFHFVLYISFDEL